MRSLSGKQREVLSFIIKRLKEYGYPPSIREIADELNITSPTGAVRHLTALEQKGYIRRSAGARAIQILEEPQSQKESAAGGMVYLPMIGRIAAGSPILAEENVEGFRPVSKRLVRHPNSFLLEVHGDSMIGDHILDGDMVIVQPQNTANDGDIVVALINDEATVKRFYRRKDYAELRPSNPKYKPLRFSQGDLQIQGKVVGVQRKL
jgi:repressor LexA